MIELWVDKYSPKNINEFVWTDTKTKNAFNSYLQSGVLKHTLLTGKPGIGKTSLFNMMLKELKVDENDVLRINASKDNNVETVRTNIMSFIQTYGIGDIKYIFLDECDMMSVQSQAILRNLMETYSNGVRFLLTANYDNKIIPALKSRCHHFHITELNYDEFLVKAISILENEKIVFNIDILESYAKSCYPDLRKFINLLEQNSINGKLTKLSSKSSSNDYNFDVIELFRKNKINEGRKLLTENIKIEEYDNFYRILYDNLDLWGNTEEQQDEAIITIAKYLTNHALVADPEINLSACIVSLKNIKRS